MVNLKSLRKAKGMTQRDLARAAKVSFLSIHRYEAGERTPDVDVAARIAAALGCTVDELIHEETA